MCRTLLANQSAVQT